MTSHTTDAAPFLASLLQRGVELWAEGGLLRFRAAAGVLTPELRAELGARKPAVLALLASGERFAPASAQQERHWFLEQLRPGSAAYAMPTAWRLRGALDVRALEGALAALVARHDALRTRFQVLGDRVVQAVAPDSGWTLPVQPLDGGEAAGALEDALRSEAARPFDLGRGPLFRALLLRASSDEHVLFLNFHHAIFDGVSGEVFRREMEGAYGALRDGLPSPLAGEAARYTEYACRQRERLAHGDLAEGVSYWTRRLGGAPPALAVPTDRPRPAAFSGEGARLVSLIPAGVAAALGALCRREGATPFMGYLAAFQVLLGRLAAEHDVVVGTPVANRRGADEEGAVGCFTNTVALRTSLAGGPGFAALLRRVRGEVLDDFAHEGVPFHLVADAVAQERDLSRHPVFQAVFSMQGAEERPLALAGVSAQRIRAAAPASKFDLTVVLAPTADGARATWEFSTELFEPGTVRRMSERFQALLEQGVAAPETSVLELDLLLPGEGATLEAWGTGAEPAPARRPVHHRVAAWAARTPESLAVSGADGALTYRELDGRAARLAARLRRAGVAPGGRVAVFLDRSAALAVAALGVLKAGGAYLPIDPALPAERVDFMLSDSGASAVVTRAGLAASLPGGHGAAVMVLDEAVDPGESGTGGPADAAYVIYTSGSTGRPKGVVVEHSALANLAAWHAGAWGVTAADRASLLAGVSFDASVWEMWPYLASGASLHVVPDEARAVPGRLRDWLVQERITVAFAPTPLAEALMAEEWPRDAALRVLLTGGEALRAYPRPGLPFVLVNAYGPTENAVAATSGVVRPRDPFPSTAPPAIGRPLAGVRLHVVDPRGAPVPAGVAGELHLGGAQVARGYLNRPALTAEHFVPDPFSREPGARLYRTGDRVRWRADGELEFVGRADFQVKVRGFRIEPGEVEYALLGCPGVRGAVVEARGERLAAFLEGDGVDVEEVRGRLGERLPEYMIPSSFTVLPAFPLGPSGKVDRAALRTLAPEGGGEAFVPPRTELEARMAEVWAEVLGVDRVGVHDNFFGLGGHSLAAARLAIRMRDRLRREVPVEALYRAGTVAGISSLLARGDGAAAPLIAAVSPLHPPAAGEHSPLVSRATHRVEPLGG